jgi:hypothetical protein
LGWAFLDLAGSQTYSTRRSLKRQYVSPRAFPRTPPSEEGAPPGQGDPGSALSNGGTYGKTEYELDTRIHTVFFFVAMPFVALVSFMVVRMATGQRQDALGSSLEQRAIQIKVSLERYFSDQIVQVRLISIDPQVQQAVAAPPPLSLGDVARRREQAWASGADAKSTAPLLDSSRYRTPNGWWWWSRSSRKRPPRSPA